MTDREMLELAAKAAGITGSYASCAPMAVPQECVRKGIGSMFWNPLTDCDDALRLAVKLHIDVCWNQNWGPWEVNAWPPDASMGASEDPTPDPYAATCLAITRAAAEIGKAMP